MALTVRWLGRSDFVPTYDAMRRFTEERHASTEDELWLCEHPSVYTQGIAGKPEHLHEAARALPIVATNRGGPVTYHGPGQVVAYPLVDLRRLRIDVRQYVHALESAVLKTLEDLGLTGHRVPGAPGIYVRLADPRGHTRLASGGPWPRQDASKSPTPSFVGLGKVAALGVKVTRHCAYHGVALNVAMDLRPYSHINPCGHPGLVTVDLATLKVDVTWQEAAALLAKRLRGQLELG
jgi:lipoyl(octanoyl) transferase